jgi:hypothetical protein
MKEIVNNLINEYRQASTEGKAYFNDLVIESLSTSETTRIPAEKAIFFNCKHQSPARASSLLIQR